MTIAVGTAYPAELVVGGHSKEVPEARALGFMPRILVLTTLPHRRPTTDRFERANGRYSLRLEARRSIGLPYGLYPRLILIYLATQAVCTKSPEIDLGRTPNDLAHRLGLTPISGPRGTSKRLHDQLHRHVSTRSRRGARHGTHRLLPPRGGRPRRRAVRRCPRLRKLLAEDTDGFPAYFTFLLAVAFVPAAGLFRSARPFINWRAFSLTSFFVVLISLLWEVTLALPYGWWGFESKMMIGLTIGAWSGLPIEEVLLWFAVTFTTVIVFEVIKIWQASGLDFLEALLGMKAEDP